MVHVFNGMVLLCVALGVMLTLLLFYNIALRLVCVAVNIVGLPNLVNVGQLKHPVTLKMLSQLLSNSIVIWRLLNGIVLAIKIILLYTNKFFHSSGLTRLGRIRVLIYP